MNIIPVGGVTVELILNRKQKVACFLFSIVFFIASIVALDAHAFFAAVFSLGISAILLVLMLSGNRQTPSKFNFKGLFNKRVGIAVLVVICVGLVIGISIKQRYKTTQYPIDLVKFQEGNSQAGWLKSQKGDISIIGWSSVEVKDKPNTYLVKYTYKTGKDNFETGWWWEVNIKEKIVRPVIGDAELEKKYGLNSVTPEPIDASKVKWDVFDQVAKEQNLALKAKWRRLKKGMTEAQVRNILGEPVNVTADSVSINWQYPKNCSVTFDAFYPNAHKPILEAWTEPIFQAE